MRVFPKSFQHCLPPGFKLFLLIFCLKAANFAWFQSPSTVEFIEKLVLAALIDLVTFGEIVNGIMYGFPETQVGACDLNSEKVPIFFVTVEVAQIVKLFALLEIVERGV
jgi:hypothetical protein